MEKEELKQMLLECMQEIENEKELDKQVDSLLGNKYMLGTVAPIEYFDENEKLISKLKEKKYWEPIK